MKAETSAAMQDLWQNLQDPAYRDSIKLETQNELQRARWALASARERLASLLAANHQVVDQGVDQGADQGVAEGYAGSLFGDSDNQRFPELAAIASEPNLDAQLLQEAKFDVLRAEERMNRAQRLFDIVRMMCARIPKRRF